MKAFLKNERDKFCTKPNFKHEFLKLTKNFLKSIFKEIETFLFGCYVQKCFTAPTELSILVLARHINRTLALQM